MRASRGWFPVVAAALTACIPGARDGGGEYDGGSEYDGASKYDSGSGYDGGDSGTEVGDVEAVFVAPGYNTEVGGALWGGARGLTVVAFGGNSWPFIAWHDGGVWSVSQLPTYGDPIGTGRVAAVAPNEYFLTTHSGLLHYADDVLVEVGLPCQGSWFWTSTAAGSTGDVWFGATTYGPLPRDGALCRWTRDAGFATIPALQGHDWTAVVTLADGGLLLGDALGGVTQLGTSTVVQVFPFRVTSFFRLNQTVWATGNGPGGLAWLRPDAGWSLVDAGTALPAALATVWAASEQDVWVGGQAGVAHYDGAQWEQLPQLPGVPTDLRVTYISGDRQLLLLGGYVENSGFISIDACAVVLRRR